MDFATFLAEVKAYADGLYCCAGVEVRGGLGVKQSLEWSCYVQRIGGGGGGYHRASTPEAALALLRGDQPDTAAEIIGAIPGAEVA